MIELPDFVTPELAERVYVRAKYHQDHGREGFWNGGPRARKLRAIGEKMALARDPKLLLLLEKSAEHLRRMNDEQASRITQQGFAKTEFTEYGQFRLAYEKVLDPRRDETAMMGLFGWLFAACAEALGC